ncbi:bidirectional sugar transporter NEC1-like [Salvia miltiorrhiza]|uniref:bidirectional sugar transporter NEC1-like n=1 Tax=Salvia miltiorrhiza TaxID=226208 RepID=UPI0025AD148A|nr:bidirectional sugar transporter NEC1-like [Salvia miltiorrhiza]
MALFSVEHLAFIFGLLGNIVSFLVFLAPMPTFYTIWKRKSSEGFQALPYSVAFFSASLLLYYAFLKTGAYMIITINGIGCFIETVYLLMYIIFAPKKSKLFTMGLIILFNVGGLGLVMAVSILAFHGDKRVSLVGWICCIFNLAVFVAPFSIMRRVIKTKSVEYMPFTLSFFLTLCATMWFFYGFFIKDYYIAFPNILGFLFGIAQMILYFVYKNAKKNDGMNLELEPSKDIEKNLSLEEAKDVEVVSK